MVPVVGTLLVGVALLAGVMTSPSWQPCVPYASHEVSIDFKKTLPTTFVLSTRNEQWSADFIIAGRQSQWRLRLRPHYKNKKKIMIILSSEGKQEKMGNWPADAFSISKWTEIDLNLTSERILEVSTRYQGDIYRVNSSVGVKCGRVEASVYQVTTAMLAWECHQQCIAQQVTADMSTKYLKGTNETFFILPEENFQLHLAQTFRDCLGEERVSKTHILTKNNLSVDVGVWNEVSIHYIAAEYHGYALRINKGPTIPFFTDRQIFKNCQTEKFLRFQLQMKSSMLAFNCNRSAYFKEDSWKQSVNECPGPTATTQTTTEHRSTRRDTASITAPPSSRDSASASNQTLAPSPRPRSTATISNVWAIIILTGVLSLLIVSIQALIFTKKITRF